MIPLLRFLGHCAGILALFLALAGIALSEIGA